MHSFRTALIGLSLFALVACGAPRGRGASAIGGGGGVVPGSGGDDGAGEGAAPENSSGDEDANANGDARAAGEGEGAFGDGDGEADGDDAGGIARTGNDSCDDVRTCVADCGDDDEACVEDCIAFGTPEAQSTFADLQLCDAFNACDGDLECLTSSCVSQLEACGVAVEEPGDGVGGGGSGGSCGDIFGCLQGCGQEDQACAQGCVQAASPEGQRAFMAVSQCLQANCADAAGEAEMQACAQEACARELNACFAGGGSDGGSPPGGGDGVGSCSGIFECGQSCPEGAAGEACFQECVGEASPQAQQQFAAVGQCLDANCAQEANSGDQDAFMDCAQGACGPELMACFGQ